LPRESPGPGELPVFSALQTSIDLGSRVYPRSKSLGCEVDATKMKLSWLSTALLGAATANALDTITAVGNKFFTKSGTQFFAKGVAYQLTEGETDFLPHVLTFKSWLVADTSDGML